MCEGLDELLGYKKQQLYPLWLAIKIIGEQREGKGNGRTDEDVSRNLARKYAPWRIGNIFHRHTKRERMVVNLSGHVHYGIELSTFQNMYVSCQKLDMVTNRLM